MWSATSSTRMGCLYRTASTWTSKSLGRNQCDTRGDALPPHRNDCCSADTFLDINWTCASCSRPPGNMPAPGSEGDLLGGPGGVGAEGLTPLGGGGGPKPPEDFSGVEQGGVTMDPMESVMEPLQFDYNSQMPMDSAPTVGLFDYTNQQQVSERVYFSLCDDCAPKRFRWFTFPRAVRSCFRETTP